VHPFSQSHTIIVFNHSKTQIAYMMHHDLFLFTSPSILSWLIPQIELLSIPGVQTKYQELSIPSHVDCNFHETDPNLRKLVKLGYFRWVFFFYYRRDFWCRNWNKWEETSFQGIWFWILAYNFNWSHRKPFKLNWVETWFHGTLVCALMADGV